MYVPKDFEETNSKEIARIISEHPLSMIICNCDDDIVANHVPLIMGKDNNFIGHIAKSNPLHNLVKNGSKTLAVFSGENSYISPNWYPTKAETRRHVPTWNYQTVHVHGWISFSHSKKEKIAAVGRLTKLLEQKYFGEDAWKISDAPKDYIDDLVENIVAFTIRVEKISAKSKLSQNRETIDFNNIVKVMEEIGKTELSESMKRLAR